jgi:NTP pyrophosphatase (non-canonical NTP hydrolase)
MDQVNWSEYFIKRGKEQMPEPLKDIKYLYDGYRDRKQRQFIANMADLQAAAVKDSKRWFPNSEIDVDIVYHTLGLAGEVGEVVEIVKKIHRGDYTLEQALDPEFMAAKGKEPLDVEATDIFFYIINLLEICGSNLLELYYAKRAVNNKRWGNVTE